MRRPRFLWALALAVLAVWGPAPAALAEASPAPGGHETSAVVDRAREADLIAAVDGSRYGFVARPELMRQARERLEAPPPQAPVPEDPGVIEWVFSAAATDAQARAQVLHREIPRKLRGNPDLRAYGLAVGVLPDGRRRLVLILK